MPASWGIQFRARGPVFDPADKVYDWVLAETPSPDWRPQVRAVYDYWRSLSSMRANGDFLLPARKDWDVLDVARYMADIRFFDVSRWDRPPHWRYRCRLVGTNQVDALGFDPTGRWLDEAEPWTWRDPRFLARQEAMMTTRAPTWRRGDIVFERSRDKGMLECLQLPFANDGVTVDMVVDYTLYMFATE